MPREGTHKRIRLQHVPRLRQRLLRFPRAHPAVYLSPPACGFGDGYVAILLSARGACFDGDRYSGWSRTGPRARGRPGAGRSPLQGTDIALPSKERHGLSSLSPLSSPRPSARSPRQNANTEIGSTYQQGEHPHRVQIDIQTGREHQHRNRADLPTKRAPAYSLN